MANSANKKKVSKKKSKNIINKLKNIDYKEELIKTKTRVIEYAKYNKQFISYVILSLISCMLLRKYTINALWKFDSTFFDFSVIILLGSLCYLFKPKKQFWYLLTLMLIYTLTNVVNTIYYAFYSSFASFGLLATLNQAAEVTNAIYEKLKFYHFIYVIIPIIFIIINRLLTKKDYFNVVSKIEVGKKLFVEVAILGGICLFINISTLSGADLSRITKQWNREYIVERYGIIIYQGNDLIQTISRSLSSLFGVEEATEEFLTYFEEHPYAESKNKYTNTFKGYNVILIHMESIMQFLIDLKINGEEVTPNLNKLVKESMYFDNFYPQVSVGTSSDTEFTVNTSLMPVQSGTVFVSYYNRNYVTLEKLLAEKGYYTFSMHANKATMWNRNKMHPTLGYRDFYSQEYYDYDPDTDKIGLGLNDSSFFTQSESIISDIKKMVNESDEYKNFMGTIITLSNHTPFDIGEYVDKDELFDVTYHTGIKDSSGDEIIYDYLEGEIIGDYIKSAHYADKCLGEFFEYVKNSPDFDKTMFVLYGDHAAQLSKKQYAKYVNFDPTTGEDMDETNPLYVEYDYYQNEIFKKTPLIIWSKDKKVKGKYSYPMGMIDVLPTISNMLGIKNEYSLGKDIFEVKNDNIVVFPNGNFLTNKVYYYNLRNEYRIFDTDELDANYIEDRKKYTDDILEISNNIIVYDLIEKTKNKTSGGSNE